jgi:hypothetical protein
MPNESLNVSGQLPNRMFKLGKLYSNLWIRVSDENFEKLQQIQKNYELKSIEEVLELLVNTNTINSLEDKSNEFALSKTDTPRSCAS